MQNLFSLFTKGDERFILHRYYSSRWALIVGVVLIGGWFLYEQYVNGVLRWDLFIILMAMALTKVLVMAYYRLTQ